MSHQIGRITVNAAFKRNRRTGSAKERISVAELREAREKLDETLRNYRPVRVKAG